MSSGILRSIPRPAAAIVALAVAVVALSSSAERVAAASFTSTASSSTNSVNPGSPVTITANITSDSALSVLVDIEVADSSGNRDFQRLIDGQWFNAGQSRSFTATWQVPSGQPGGLYTVRVGVFTSDWSTRHHWNATADTFSVGTSSGSGSTTPPPPSTSGKFVTLGPGATLPSDSECAGRVRRSSFEPRPGNGTANHTMPPVGLALPDWTGVDSRANTKIQSRISGRFTGTTDEIIQWAACKWGLDEDILRAVAVNESWWRQTDGNDWSDSATQCAKIGKKAPCAQSYGLMQLKTTAWPGTYPYASTSTAFNLDYVAASYRMCFEGYITWLEAKNSAYRAGDFWGCVGAHYSGGWYDSGANWYIPRIKKHLGERTWTRSGF